MMITAAQSRMARAALRWHIADVAKASQVATATIHRFETEQRQPIPATLMALKAAFEAAGIEFVEGGAVLKSAGAGR